MLKRYSMIIAVLALLVSCTNEQPPQITKVSYAEQVLTIELDNLNRTDTEHIKNNIRIYKDGYTGKKMKFSVFAVKPDGDGNSKKYELKDFYPAIRHGIKYYIYFNEGAFGNYGQWSLSGIDDKSDPGTYMFEG